MYAQCTLSGVFLHNINHPEWTHHLLPHIGITEVLRDHEGELWFSTTGQGVFRPNTLDMHNLYASSITDNKTFAQQIMGFVKFDTSVLVAANNDLIYRLSINTGEPEKRSNYQ